MRSVRFMPAARAELLEAYDWYEAILPGLGERFRGEIDATIEHIATNPQIFAEIYRNVRRALLKKISYGLLFRIEPDAVFVIACFHSSRNPRIWQQRT